MSKIYLEKVEDTSCEVFKGYGISFLITHSHLQYLEDISKEWRSGSSLPYGGAEYGIQGFLKKNLTPDDKYGLLCSAWIISVKKESKSQTLKRFKKLISLKLRTTLFPKLGITIFNPIPSLLSHTFPTISNNENVYNNFNSACDELDCVFYLGDFGDGYSNIIHDPTLKINILSIPMMGGDFLIESIIPIYSGYLGANLFIHLNTTENLFHLENHISQILCSNLMVAQIFGMINCGSKLGFRNLTTNPKENREYQLKYKISTNLVYCPSLRSNIPPTKVENNVESIIEIVFNSHSIDALKKSLKNLVDELISNEDIVKISSGEYNGKLGGYPIYLHSLFDSE